MATVTAEYATAYGSYKKLAISAGETPLSEAEWIASLKGDKGEKGDTGDGVPDGGTTGQALVKASNADGDVTWGDVQESITIDAALNGSSNNPVRNSILTSALASKLTVNDSDTVIGLSDIPVNTAGHIVLRNGQHPYTDFTGNMNVQYICVGEIDGGAKALFVQRGSTGVVYTNSFYNNSWLGWQAVTYILPIATASVLGGVKPVAKTSAMTQSVGVNSSGALFTEPSPTVDTALSATSTNPVQNKAIKAEIDSMMADVASDIATYRVPAGGTTGQVLTKNSNTSNDVGWTSLPLWKGTQAEYNALARIDPNTFYFITG